MFIIVHETLNFSKVALLEFSLGLAKKAGDYLKVNFGKGLLVEYKSRINPVTPVDRGSQDIICNAIEKAFPDHSIISEEGKRKDTGNGYTWFIDPLDGTVNYIHNIPIFCVSISLYRYMEPYIGVCYNPMRDELFYAEKGKGAFMNGERISVSSITKLIDSLLVTGFPYSTDNLDISIARFQRLLGKVQGIRRIGSAALDLCYVAKGSFDGFWEVGLQSWDVAAGVLVVSEAGGIVTGLDGRPLDIGVGDILASNRKIHNDILMLM
jgi:myo-inositol-1(or 4)-monophosphatase